MGHPPHSAAQSIEIRRDARSRRDRSPGTEYTPGPKGAPLHVADSLRVRLSHTQFDASAPISEAEVIELVGLAQQAPSSFNIQFTRYAAVTDAGPQGPPLRSLV